MSIPVRWLTEKLAITGQMEASDVPTLAEMGFKTLICNRPDFEYGPDQPTASAIASAARDCGLAFVYLPVTPDGGSAADAKAMGEALGAHAAPVLAYCKTGGRCMALIGVAARMGCSIPQ